MMLMNISATWWAWTHSNPCSGGTPLGKLILEDDEQLDKGKAPISSENVFK